MSAQMGVLCRPLQTLACMTAEHLCSFAWLCQWQKLCPASDNHAGVADLSVLWLLMRLRRICSDSNTFELRAKELAEKDVNAAK